MTWPMDESRNVNDTASAHLGDHNQLHDFANDIQGWAFGGISKVDNAVEITVTTQNVPVQVTTFDTNNASLGCTPDHTNDHITIDRAGTYLILFSATVNSVSGAASRIEVAIYKNNGDTEIIPHVNRNLGGGGGESGVVSASGLAVLAQNDTVELWVTNETNTQNYVIEDASLDILRVGA